jgi:hypothetical protein
MDSSEVVAGTNATATQYNNLRKDNVLGKSVLGTETDAATITIDWSDKTKGKVRTVTLGAAGRTVAFSNATVGQMIILRAKQDGTGGRTITTWPAGINWQFSLTPTQTPTANKTDVYGFLCTATNTYDGYILGSAMGS